MAEGGDLIDFNEDHDNDDEEEEEVNRTWADGNNMKCKLICMSRAGCQLPRMKKPPF